MATPSSASRRTSASSIAIAAVAAAGPVTDEQMRRTQSRDREWMKLIPIAWEGCVRKKGDWLPRWDDVFLTLEGLTLRVYESKAKYLELQAQEQQRRLAQARLRPLGSPVQPPSSRSASMVNVSPVKGPALGPPAPSAAPSSNGNSSTKNRLTVTAVKKENAGKPHGFCVSTLEKKPLHLAVDSEIERVIWLHLIAAALEQQTQLPKLTERLTQQQPQPQGSTISVVTPSRALASTVSMAKTLLGTPIVVNLHLLYEAWGSIQCRKGDFSHLLPSLHPTITITSNYPPCVPIAGEYHGHEGFLGFFSKLHGSIDVAQYVIEQIARSGDLAVVTGRETIKNTTSGRKFRHLWKHELRFQADGRVSHINIIADKTAAAVAFGVQAEGPSLELPHEQEESASTCPPGEIRVVCICGESMKKRKPLPASANLKVTIGLNNFPHLTLKNGNAGGPSSNNVGSLQSYSTKASKNGNGNAPFWAETLSLQFSGAVPGTSTCLFIEVWSISVMGDELVGCTKVNLAHCLGTSTGTEEEVASFAVPKWYELKRAEYFASFSSSGGGSILGVSEKESSSTAATKRRPTTSDQSSDALDESCGRLQLSISFLPYAEEVELSFADRSSEHRRSFDRLQALHEETVRHSLVDRRSSVTMLDSADNDDDFEDALEDNRGATNSGSAQHTPEGTATASVNDMYTFTVASTKFRVYKRYQLIRAIGHGAYGVVIAASDQITGNSVAIKNIPKTFDDLVDAKRIVREIRLMRHLTHPNIVQVLDVMRPPSLAAFEDTYIVTDLMETDLHRVINSQEVLSSDHIAYVTYQMLCAIRYIHSAQILHRDIKPSNILINRDCLVKICDFGLARGIEVGDDGESKDQALTEYVVTRWYRAPELLLASRYTTAIDLWSIGCILVEMFTRKALFPGHDHVHQLHLILQLVGSPTADDMGFITNIKARRWMARQAHHDAKSLSTVCPNAPPEAIELMTSLLQFDPRKRISVDDAIAHPFLAAFRKDPEQSAGSEALAVAPFDFSFEQEPQILEKDTLRRLIFEDVCAFHPEAQEELNQFMREQERLAAEPPAAGIVA